MRKMLLLAAALGAMATTPASANGLGAVQSHALTSFGLSIVVRDAPKVVHYRHYPGRHLRPQPWPRRFSHHAPRPVWHKPWRPRPGHFHRSYNGHDSRRWHFHRSHNGHDRHFRGPGRFRDGDRNHAGGRRGPDRRGHR